MNKANPKPALSDDWDPALDDIYSAQDLKEMDAETAAYEKANPGTGPEYDLDLHLARPIG